MALVRTDVSVERNASAFRATRISETRTPLAVTSNRSTLHILFLRSVLPILVIANVFRSSSILVILMMEAVHSSETLVLTRATRLDIPEDDIPHSHHREILRSYIALTGWAL
jgi:hypothetical protein